MYTDGELNPVLGFSIVFVALLVGWFLVSVALRYTSCWNRLEKLYRHPLYDPTENYGLQWVNIASPFDPSGTFNRFVWTIKVGANKKGVFISGLGRYDPVFRPILIPWDELMIVEQPFIGLNRMELIPTKVPEVQLILSKALAERLNQARSTLNGAVSNNASNLNSGREEYKGPLKKTRKDEK